MTEEMIPTTTVAASSVVVAQSRDPGMFCGTDGVDVEEWLAIYERASTNNRWDDALILTNMVFYLQGIARVRFQNHEEEIESWDTCKEKIRALSDAACEAGAKVYEAVNELIKKLPAEHSETLNRESDWVPGVTLTTMTLTGLENCEILGPVQSYCRGNDDLTLVELHCTPLSNTINWSMCNGRNGTLVTTIRYARMSVEFFTEHAANSSDVRLVSAGAVAPSELTGVSLTMTGSSKFLNNAASILVASFSEAIREMWLGTLPGFVLDVLHDIKRKRHGS